MIQYIMKKDGNVYLVTEHDVYGRHKTISFMGREFIEVEDKPKKKKKEED